MVEDSILIVGRVSFWPPLVTALSNKLLSFAHDAFSTHGQQEALPSWIVGRAAPQPTFRWATHC